MTELKLPISTKNGCGASGATVVNLRCPVCRKEGVFAPLGNVSDAQWSQIASKEDANPALFHAGIRRCPNRECLTLVFIITDEGEFVRSFPPETIDFDPENVPNPLVQSLEEAVKCHAAGCYRAAALMVRKLLEEICEDRDAKGDDLKKRVAALGQTAIIPKELLEAAEEIRILGNDAAHVTAKAYDDIGKHEAELALELAKEILKALFQYKNLLERLKKLKN